MNRTWRQDENRSSTDDASRLDAARAVCGHGGQMRDFALPLEATRAVLMVSHEMHDDIAPADVRNWGNFDVALISTRRREKHSNYLWT